MEHPAQPPALIRSSRARPFLLSTPAITSVLFLIAFVASLPVLQGSGRALDHGANLARFLSRFWPPDLSVLVTVAPALGETFQIAFLATLGAVLLSLPIAAAASKNISPSVLVCLVRLLHGVIRAVPSLVWALLTVAVAGANALAGVAALILYSIGYLGKFFSDAFESSDAGVAEALRITGANRFQAFQYGIWPHARPLIWSHALWMLEYNIRSATIIGYVGAGGIGAWLHTYQEFYQWDRFAAVLLVILAVVLLLDAIGARLRRRLAGRS